jgi:ribonucleoside-diphosphate reductase beta chain
MSEKTMPEKAESLMSWDDIDEISVTTTTAAKQSKAKYEHERKLIINGTGDVNQLAPFKYEWAWRKYLDGCANHWMPNEINMNADVALWKTPNGLTDDERVIVKRSLGFF